MNEIDVKLMIDPPARRPHPRNDRLRRKKMWPEVDRLIVVPELDRHVFNLMPGIECGIVDEHRHRAMSFGSSIDGRSQGLDIPQIRVQEQGPFAEIGFKSIAKREARIDSNVDEGDAAALSHKSLCHSGADTGAASGDQH